MKSTTPAPTTSTASLSVRFAESVRVLSGAARRRGMVVPAFRSPPARPDVDRSLRRRADGACTVAVRLSGRPFTAVQADLVESLVVVNDVDAAQLQAVRRSLWNALAQAGLVDGPPSLAAA